METARQRGNMKHHPVWNALSHITVIFSAMFITFFCIDRVNPAMDFLGSALSKWCLLVYCAASMVTAMCSAIYLFQRDKSAAKRHAAHRPADGREDANEAEALRRMQVI